LSVTPVPEQENVLIFNFGAQYAQLIARRVRELHVHSEIVPPTTTAERVGELAPKGIILSGGPASVYQQGAPGLDSRVLEMGVPVLGICYGEQLLAHMLGGRVGPGQTKEYGRTEIEIVGPSVLFAGLQRHLDCWMSHGDIVLEAPPGFSVTARSANSPAAAIENPQQKIFGIQFHPEVSHTPFGRQLLANFLYQVCGCKGEWTARSIAERAVEQVRDQVGERARVLCAVSGGIDSMLTAALVARAVGERLTSVFVDHGLLRKGEREEVVEAYERHIGPNLRVVDAKRRFLERLRGVADPEQKRKVIGEEFVAVFEEEASRLGPFEFLAQGTLYPDVVESGGGVTARIKGHHNVAGLPERMQFRLVEPLRNLFKDEVRRLGEEVGLPESIVWRQPFPGPGLAVRIIGAVTEERLETVREADAIVREEVKRAGLTREIFQAFAVLTPVQSVGVMGDQRTYRNVLAVRAVTSEDAMTAEWARLPYEVLARISNRIINEVPGVNRVVYDISSKPPATIDWE